MDALITTLDHDGGIVLPGACSRDVIRDLLAVLGELPQGEAVRERAGAVYASRNVLALCPPLVHLWRSPAIVDFLREVLGPEAGLVRGLYFNKPPEQTWALPWHKDLTIAVSDNLEVPGYSKPRLRAGVWHCEPPVEVLHSMLTLRIHLDDVTVENGPLEVLPGSHLTGKELRIDRFEPRRVLVQAGNVFAMRPLLARCSGRSAEGTTRHRRVLHLEFSARSTLPGGHRWHEFYPLELQAAAQIRVNPRRG